MQTQNNSYHYPFSLIFSKVSNFFYHPLGKLIVYKGVLLGFYNIPDLLNMEVIGIIFWQNNTKTKIKQANLENWITSVSTSDKNNFGYDHTALVYSHC